MYAVPAFIWSKFLSYYKLAAMQEWISQNIISKKIFYESYGGKIIKIDETNFFFAESISMKKKML